jgi:hypothetical protein
MITEFFHQQPRAHAYGRLSSVMNSGTVSLRGAVCYVTEEGCRLLEENIERFKTKDSFFIAGYNETSAIPAINRLCELAPGKFYFHGIAAKGSEDWEGPLIPGLMHSKLIYAEGDTTATVWVGSHNLTHNALHGVNIESATITTGDRNNPFFQQVRRHLDAIRAESFLGPAAIKKNPLLDKPIRELVLIHCEASEEQILQITEKKNCYMSIHLRQDAYDSLCRPPASPDKHVRLHIYAQGDLNPFGPIAAPKVIKAGELFGVNFTEKSVRKGNTAGWPEMSFKIEEPVGDLFQPLKVCIGPHDPVDDVTVCAIRVDDALAEADEADNCCILTERPSSEVIKGVKKLELGPLIGERKKRHVFLIESLRSVTTISGDNPVNGSLQMGKIHASAGEELLIDRDSKRRFRFIHNGKLFALPDTLPDNP